MGDLNVNQLKNLDAAEQVRHVCVGVEGGSYTIAIAPTCLCVWRLSLQDSHCSMRQICVYEDCPYRPLLQQVCVGVEVVLTG